MKTAIIYASKRGATEKIAKLIEEKINISNDVTLISLSHHPNPDISPYQKVILGTAIYAGNPRKNMKVFCDKNKELLSQKTIGLYISCMFPDPEKRKEQLKNAFPEDLHSIAIAKDILGGEFSFEKMNFIERLVVKKVANIDASLSNINFDGIYDFCQKFK